LYFPDDYLEEIKKESLRQDRSMSWLVQKAWELSRERILGFPSANPDADDDENDDPRERE
jgi:uncharacterized small protein (TIGR04563 family)